MKIFSIIILVATLSACGTNSSPVSLERQAFTTEVVNSPEKMKNLLDEGLDPNTILNTAPGYPESLIHFTTKWGRFETVQILLEAGADPNAKSFGFGKTPLFQAAGDGKFEIVKILIKNGADINALDDYENNALREAFLRNKSNTARLLLENGTKLEQVNSEGDSMRTLAEKYSNPIIMRIITEIEQKNIERTE